MNLNGISQLPEPVHQALGGGFGMQAIEEIGAGFAIRLFAQEYVVGHDENGMGHGPNRPLLAAPPSQTLVLRREISILDSAGRMSGLHQAGAQNLVTLT